MFDIDDLVANLQVEPQGKLLFRAGSLLLPLPKIFGGQVLAQAFNAAVQTVHKGHQAHSMHAYFLRPGDASLPIFYEVDPIRDGGTFVTRRVMGKQNDAAIFSCAVSFQMPEVGFEHQAAMPGNIPAPETLDKNVDLVQRLPREPGSDYQPFEWPLAAIDIRSVNGDRLPDQQAAEPEQGFWFRYQGPLSDQQDLHRTLLTYISDKELMLTGLRPHGVHCYSEGLQLASLDHALWFHDELRVDEWLYYHMESPRACGGRALGRGSFYTRDGRLVASSIQEGLIRQRIK